MQERKHRKKSSNPLNNLNISAFLEPKTKKAEKETLKELEEEYRKILKRNIQREYRAYRVCFKNHPDLLYIAFCSNRGSAKWRATKYFKNSFHPFFSNDEDCSREMLNCKAYRIQDFDEYYLKGLIPIPKLLKTLDISMPCSVCKKGHFKFSDYIAQKCFIIEGEGNLNPFTKGYLLCPQCYKRYIAK